MGVVGIVVTGVVVGVTADGAVVAVAFVCAESSVGDVEFGATFGVSVLANAVTRTTEAFKQFFIL
jgi:hypothetical protein